MKKFILTFSILICSLIVPAYAVMPPSISLETASKTQTMIQTAVYLGLGIVWLGVVYIVFTAVIRFFDQRK